MSCLASWKKVHEEGESETPHLRLRRNENGWVLKWIEIGQLRDAHNQRNRNQPLDFDIIKPPHLILIDYTDHTLIS